MRAGRYRNLSPPSHHYSFSWKLPKSSVCIRARLQPCRYSVNKAERDLLFPSIAALGVVGRTPYSKSIERISPFPGWYGAVGVNVNIPIFNGFLYPARSREARLRARAGGEQSRDLKDRIANDVRTRWLSAINAYHRIAVTQQFVDQTNLAVDLSQTRHNLGLSSIVELSQAELQQTEAQIRFTAAKYQYRIAQSVLRFQVAAP
ncbi:MAG: TolC family protein [Acidobacteriota bacterium]|nr:TolC family protein [Acidobacteriota bacterium]